MTDGIIKGTGNSRYLKSVANALALYPTHESLMEALAAGTLPIDLNGINPAGWNTLGDKLDKATLLTDALCTALGLATTATPTQAMEKLRVLVNGKTNVSFGSYAGNNASSRTIYLPGNAKAVILCTNKGVFTQKYSTGYSYFYGGIFSPGKNLINDIDGLVASVSGSLMNVYYNNSNQYNLILSNVSNTTYYYICFY